MRALTEIRPGTTLGRYEILAPIARGGMAAVWVARLKGSRGFTKTVAVKTMLPEVSDDPRFEQMFLDEARLAARIRHPNVAEILDLGEEGSVLYHVLEYVDGEPLTTIRRAAALGGGIPLPLLARTMADVCAGLHAAHELTDDDGHPQGLVHRDVSPQNILVSYDGVVKLVDFGVAKVLGRTADASDSSIKGKPSFMAPEQARAQPVDRRADVFAAGIVLYLLAAGTHPFRDETDLLTLERLTSDEPIEPPRKYNPKIPPRLEAIIQLALRRDPERRYQTAAAMRRDLEAVFEGDDRVDSEDVGRYVTGLLGDVGRARRKEVQRAIQLADERDAGREAELISIPDLVDVRPSQPPPDGGPDPRFESVPPPLILEGPPSSGPLTTPLASAESVRQPHRGTRWSALAVVAIGALVAGGFVVAALGWRSSTKSEARPAMAPSAVPPVGAAKPRTPTPEPDAAPSGDDVLEPEDLEKVPVRKPAPKPTTTAPPAVDMGF